MIAVVYNRPWYGLIYEFNNTKMELTEKQVRKLAEDRIFKCYGDGFCDLDAMINLFVDGYAEATRQINLTIPIVSNCDVCYNNKAEYIIIKDGNKLCNDCIKL